MPLYSKVLAASGSAEEDSEPAQAALGQLRHESKRLTPEKNVAGGNTGLVFSTPQKWHQAFLDALLRPDDWRPSSGRMFHFKAADILRLCDAVEAKLREDPALLEVHAPVKVIGDIHGQFGDLMHLFKVYGAPSRLGDIGYLDYLFLGDYVDRGEWSLETVCLLFALRVEFPGQVHLLRGNHETMATNAKYGFLAECKGRLGPVDGWHVWRRVNEVFNWLPLAAHIDGKILCLHGGLSEHLSSLDQIAAIPRPLTFEEEGPEVFLAYQLLWNDPNESDAVLGSHASVRGHEAQTFSAQQVEEFCQRNGLELIVRAHQCVRDGFERFARGRLITVFSAANYCGRYDNAGALLLVGRDHVVVPKIIRPQLRNPRVFEARAQFSQLMLGFGAGGGPLEAGAARRRDAERAGGATSPLQQRGRSFVQQGSAPWCEPPGRPQSPSPQRTSRLPAPWKQQQQAGGDMAPVPSPGQPFSPPAAPRQPEPSQQQAGNGAAAGAATVSRGKQGCQMPAPSQPRQVPAAACQQSSIVAVTAAALEHAPGSSPSPTRLAPRQASLTSLEHGRSTSPSRLVPRQASQTSLQHGSSPSPTRLVPQQASQTSLEHGLSPSHHRQPRRRQPGASAAAQGSLSLLLRDAQKQLAALPSIRTPREDLGELLQRVTTASPAVALVQRSAGSTGSVSSGRIPARRVAGAERAAQAWQRQRAALEKQQLGQQLPLDAAAKGRGVGKPWAAGPHKASPLGPEQLPAGGGRERGTVSVGCWGMQAAAAAGLARARVLVQCKLRGAKAAARSKLKVARALARSKLQGAKAAAKAGCTQAKADVGVAAAAVAAAAARLLAPPAEPLSPKAAPPAAAAAAGAWDGGMAPLAEGIMWANAAWEWDCRPSTGQQQQQGEESPPAPTGAGSEGDSALLPVPGPIMTYSEALTAARNAAGSGDAQPSRAAPGEEAGSERGQALQGAAAGKMQANVEGLKGPAVADGEPVHRRPGDREAAVAVEVRVGGMQGAEAVGGAEAEDGMRQAKEPPMAAGGSRGDSAPSSHPLVYSAGVLLSVGAVFLSKLSTAL